MSYIFKTDLADKSNYGSARSASVIKYIVLHYTANDGDSSSANAKYFKTANRKASAHYFVDDTTVIQSVPDNYIAWSVGGTRYSDYVTTGGASLYKICKNTNSLNIEMCDTVKNGTYDVSEKTLENTIELVKMLMSKYNVTIDRVIRHFDVTGKKCPAYFVDKTKWDALKARITTKNNTSSSPTVSSVYSFKDFVKEIQTALGVTVDGIPGVKTLAATITISATVNRKHMVVKPLQKYLNSIGYNCGTADGIAGAKFTTSVKNFQKANGCTADGEITAKAMTWKKLLKLA